MITIIISFTLKLTSYLVKAIRNGVRTPSTKTIFGLPKNTHFKMFMLVSLCVK